MTQNIDLSQLSAAELETLSEEVAAQLSEKREEEREAAFAQIDALAESLGLTKAQLAAHFRGKRRKPRQPPRPKYRNPDNPTETWSGRGRKPAWVEAHLGAGRQLRDLTV